VDVTKLEVCWKERRAENPEKSRFSEEQVIGILAKVQPESPVKSVCGP
jgi:hypothetical protein